jgi:peroxiredoxin
VEAFAREKGIDYTVLLDPDNAVASQYGVAGIPANILIGSDGVIKYKETRPPPDTEIASLLSQGPLAVTRSSQ